ncbi:ParB/RepB/Spo0J family partition protein [Deinococcus sp. QL22]|uniref:ParB/RepB/Spo0J family partition protein n=1 Tax=Deinococcus sp. QL22 TaxID=2939437 RepID=UPI002017C024|nr:ParB/RepB/Spo0J family partition protein [Deinococcus sp. QL22]UQN08948.1 ParB/RepB/Spo0J family partition protein [Deinococcus sp. QL22]
MSRKERPKLQIGPLKAAGQPSELMSGFTGSQAPLAQSDLALDLIQPRTQQPRRFFNAETLTRLTESVRAHGILQPLSVHQTPEGRYDLISGERRLRAAQAAELSTVPVKIFTGLSERQIQQLAAIENLQREDLNPVDEVDAVLDILAAELDLPRAQLTPRLERWKSMKMRDPALGRASEEDREAIAKLDTLFRGLARGEWASFVANRLPVLRLPSALLEAVREGRLEYTKAIALRRAPEPLQSALLREAPSLSVQQLRQRVRADASTPEVAEGVSQAITTLQGLLKVERLAQLGAADQKRLVGLLTEASALLTGEQELTGQGRGSPKTGRRQGNVRPDE